MDNAHIAGDVVMLNYEVNAVIKTFRANNIEVVAVHSHMLYDKPSIKFLYYLGTRPAPDLAKAFRRRLTSWAKNRMWVI